MPSISGEVPERPTQGDCDVSNQVAAGFNLTGPQAGDHFPSHANFLGKCHAGQAGLKPYFANARGNVAGSVDGAFSQMGLKLGDERKSIS